MQKKKSAVRAIFSDAKAALDSAAPVFDPVPEEARDGIPPGAWPGSPMEKMPPGSPVVPLGVDGKTFYFIDTLGQLMAIATSEWNKKTLSALYSLTPNYPYWAWPRFAAAKKGQTRRVNGMETDHATACLMKAASERGLFDPADKVRGRGGWVDSHGEFIWHSGEHLFRVDQRRRLERSAPGDVDGVFYARRPPVLTPWQEPISESESPGHAILAALNTWIWERPLLDPLLALGFFGVAFLGAALPWRPTVFFSGDKGRGKSTLQGIYASILGGALHATADTTAAGIYQRVKQDSLPVSVDELESEEDPRKVIAVIKLARLAASGAEMFRGGADHEGVQFRARNAFLFSSINPPPLKPQDKSRIALLNIARVDPARASAAKLENPEVMGRQILRRLMDEWPRFDQRFTDWRNVLRSAGFDGRAQDTYGILLTAAAMLIGDEAMEAAGLPVTELERLGTLLSEATSDERATQSENWRNCLDRILTWTIDNYRAGERPIIGDTLEKAMLTATKGTGDVGIDFKEARARLMQCGLGLKEPEDNSQTLFLAVPPDGAQLEKIFAGTEFQKGVWMHALRQAPHDVVRRDLKNGQVVKIAGRAKRCLLVDLAKLYALEA